MVLYLDGALSGADKKVMEELMAADPALKAEFESLQQTRAAVRYYGLKQKVGSLHNRMMKEMQSPVKRMSPGKKFLRYSLATAASLVLLVGAYLAYNFFTLSPDKVFSANYSSFELSTLRDGDNADPTAVEKAFRELNYKEVLRIHDAGEDLTPKGEFLCGIAALELKDDTKAIKCFKEVLDAGVKTGQPVLVDEAEYYLSLGYIRNKDYDFALPILLKIKNEPEHKYNRAVSSRLIRKVKMLKWR
jgi:tetratricopeptide (TPR) repeat protein